MHSRGGVHTTEVDATESYNCIRTQSRSWPHTATTMSCMIWRHTNATPLHPALRKMSQLAETTTRDQLWSHAGVRACINAPGITTEQREYILNLIPLFRGVPNIHADAMKMSVEYFRAKSQQGRRYERPRALQGVSGIIRRICSARYYRDMDIENAFPVILEGKLVAAGIPCPTLSLLTSQRDACLADVMNVLSVPRSTAKNLFISILHGGNWHNNDNVVAGATHPMLDAFSEEIHRASRTLASLHEYTQLRNLVENDSSKKNKMGSFVSLVCQVEEDKAITAIENALKDQGEQVDVLVFDGVMVRSTTHHPVNIDELSRRASEAIQISIVVREKPFDLLASDLEILHPDDVQSVLDVSGLSADTQTRLVAAMGPPIVIPDKYAYRLPLIITTEHNDPRVLPITMNVQTQMMLIGASMGLGKTHQLRAYLQKNSSLHRVLIITARQQQAYSAQGVFSDIAWDDKTHGFTNYLDCPDGTLYKQNKLVIQYESLHRLCDFINEEEVMDAYDLIIVDEVRSAVTQAQCETTNKTLLLRNYEIFQGLLGTSRSICLDADIEADGAVWDCVSRLMAPERIQFHRYTHVALRREMVLVSEAVWLRMLCEAVANNKRIGLPCRSKMKMNDLLGMDEMASCSKLKFDSDSTKEEMLKLKDINQTLDGVQVLAITSKVTTAADIQQPFDAVYMHSCAATGPTPRDTLQMIGRWRNVTSGKVFCCLPPMQNTGPGVTFKTEREALYSRKRQSINMQSVLSASGWIREGSRMSYAPHPLLNLTARAHVEANSCHTMSFIRQSRGKGWRLDFVPPVDVESTEQAEASLAATHAEHKEERDQQKLDIATEVQNMTPTERTDETARLQQLHRNHELTPVDRVRRNTIHVANRLPADTLMELDLKPLVFAADDIAALYRVSAVMRNTLSEQNHSDACAIARAPSGEHAVFRGAAARKMHSVVQLMGFQGVCDTHTRVRLSELDAQVRNRLVAQCREVFLLLGEKRPRVRVSPQQHITWARNVLRLLKLQLRSKQIEGTRSTDRTRQYWLAHECEGFLQLVEDFNPYPNGPPSLSDVPIRRSMRSVKMHNSHTVARIEDRETSRVCPLPATKPYQDPGVVYMNKPRLMAMDTTSSCNIPRHSGGFIIASVVPPTSKPCTGSIAWLPPPPPTGLAMDMPVGLESGPSNRPDPVDDQIPSNAELAEMQAEPSEDEMGDLGCYADGPYMQDDTEMGELGCYADGSPMHDDRD